MEGENQAYMKSADFLRTGTLVIHIILETSHLLCVFVYSLFGLICLCFQILLITFSTEFPEIREEKASRFHLGLRVTWGRLSPAKSISHCFVQALNRTELLLDAENNVTTCSTLPQLAATSRKGPKYLFSAICNISSVFGQRRRSGCVNDSSRWQSSFDEYLVASELARHQRWWRKCLGTHSIVADMSKTMRWRSDLAECS